MVGYGIEKVCFSAIVPVECRRRDTRINNDVPGSYVVKPVLLQQFEQGSAQRR